MTANLSSPSRYLRVADDHRQCVSVDPQAFVRDWAVSCGERPRGRKKKSLASRCAGAVIRLWSRLTCTTRPMSTCCGTRCGVSPQASPWIHRLAAVAARCATAAVSPGPSIRQTPGRCEVHHHQPAQVPAPAAALPPLSVDRPRGGPVAPSRPGRDRAAPSPPGSQTPSGVRSGASPTHPPLSGLRQWRCAHATRRLTSRPRRKAPSGSAA